MCYPKGPRCSSSASELLTRAKIRARTERSLEASEEVDKAQRVYDATPAGMRELERRVKQSRQSNCEYQMRLDLGRATRKAQLAANKLEERGDLKHPRGNHDIMFPKSFHQFCDDHSEEDKISYDSQIMSKIVDDSAQWVSKLNTEEIEAAAWFTSNGSTELNQHLTGTSKPFYLPTKDDEDWDNFEEREEQAAKDHLQKLDDTARHLDTALHKGKRTTPIKLYRGVSGTVLENQGYKHYQTDEYIAATYTKDETYTSPVFMSSSLEYSRGKGFGTSGIVLEVLGKTVGPVSNISAWSTTEKEYILPRNVPYLVRDIKIIEGKHGDKEYIIQLEEK